MNIATRGKRGRDFALAMVSGLDAATQRHEVHGVHHRTSPCQACTGRMMSGRSCPVSSCGGLVRSRKVLSRPHTVLPGSSSCPRPEVLGTRHAGCAIPDEIAASVALGWGYVAAHLVRTYITTRLTQKDCGRSLCTTYPHARVAIDVPKIDTRLAPRRAPGQIVPGAPLKLMD